MVEKLIRQRTVPCLMPCLINISERKVIDMKESAAIDKMPEVFASIVLCFNEFINVKELVKSLKDIGIVEIKISKPKCESTINVEIAIVNYEKFWYLDDALSKMFSHVDDILVELKEIVKKFSGTVHIDISFFQFGTYPAIAFSRKTIEKIDFLEATFGIDPQ